MYPTVTIRQRDRAVLYVTIVEPLMIGRDCDGLLLADEKISRQHVRLTPQGNNLLVVDLGSTNGSFVDRVRVTGETLMTPGIDLQIGDTIIRVEAVPHAV